MQEVFDHDTLVAMVRKATGDVFGTMLGMELKPLMAYVETESGRRFLESLRIEQGEPTMPFRRILNGVQSGIVLSSFGVGMLLLHGYGVAPEEEFTIFGALALALGIGFGIAALASYLLSRSFGLLERGSHASGSNG